MRALSFVAALLLFAQAPSGVFEIELWPGEGRPRFQAVANDLAIHETPSSSARIPQQAVACKPGDVIEYLQYRAEGTCFVRVGDQVVDAHPCPAQDDAKFRVATKPKTEWWIRVVVERVPVGWALVDGRGIKQNGRTF